MSKSIIFLLLNLIIFLNLYSQITSNIIYQEDFNNPISVWTKNDKTAHITSGLLYLQSGKRETLHWYATQIFIDYRKNFTIQTKIKQINGAKNQGYGLTWGSLGWQNSYFFLISSSGYYTIGAYINGKVKNIKSWTKNTAIKPYDFNILKIEKKGNRYIFYINNESVYTCRFNNFYGQFQGFMLQRNIKVAIDYLHISTDNQIIEIANTDFTILSKKNLGQPINTVYTEIAPIISPDGKRLYFARVYDPHNIGKYKECDIWYADRDKDGNFKTPVHMGKPLNNVGVNAVFAVTPDENALLVEGVYNKDGSFKSEQGVSITYRTKNGWSVPVPLKIDGFYNKNIYETYTISNDMQVLIMAIEMDDSYGDTDLYISFRKKDGTYTKPQNLGPIINTPGSEATPFIASDGKTLYFCSDGHPGFGSCDIFMTKRLDDTWLHWSKPKNLGPQINTSDWDSYFSVSAKGDEAFFVSTTNSYGFEDIYTLKLKPEYRPEPVVLIYGKVLNKNTNKPIGAQITYKDISTGKTVGIARSNPANGEYKITLPYGRKYAFEASAKNFIAISDNIDLTNKADYKEIKRNLYLVPAQKGQIIELHNIFFARASAKLLPESYTELNRLVDIMRNNPKMKIEIRGHTDNRGNPEKLMELSKKRANAVRNYLIKNGIDSLRITIKAFGGTQPVYTGKSDKGHAKNRRVEFKILQI